MSQENNNSRSDFLERLLYNLRYHVDDIHSTGLLQSLLNGYPYIPVTTFSLRPFCLNVILNDIVINQRRNIIEFGSGISTLLMGRLIKRNDLNARVTSFEHNDEWLHLMRTLIKNEQLDNIIQLEYAPLKESKFSKFSCWYDPEVLTGKIGSDKFDLVVIDGPPAWENGKEKARYPALPYLNTRLANSFCIFLDDADRQGEQMVLQLWKQQFGYDFSILGNRLACYGKNSFESKPF